MNGSGEIHPGSKSRCNNRRTLLTRTIAYLVKHPVSHRELEEARNQDLSIIALSLKVTHVPQQQLAFRGMLQPLSMEVPCSDND